MACALIRDPATGAAVGHACARGKKEKLCRCGDVATILCDGRVPGARGRTRLCDAPVCGRCTTHVDDRRDLCRACADAAAPAGVPAGALAAYTDGSGTVASLPCGGGVVLFDGGRVVAEALGRAGVGVEAQPAYVLDLMPARFADVSARFSRPARRPKAPRPAEAPHADGSLFARATGRAG